MQIVQSNSCHVFNDIEVSRVIRDHIDIHFYTVSIRIENWHIYLTIVSNIIM